jgi:nicotinate-nucleotide pyrophosphorylase (carboxylating)
MHSIQHLIDIALNEDIGPGDITTDHLVDPGLRAKGAVAAKEPLVVAGLDVARQVFERLDPQMTFRSEYHDGDNVDTGKSVLEVEGNLRALLTAERTALNFLQHLSGIATHVSAYMEKLGPVGVRLVDTRKTTPGWRVLEKYAVRVGGATNHRMGLYDGVLIKDNHIAVCGGIGKSIDLIRRRVSHLIKIEVEVTDLAGVKEAVAAGADVIMLDNMSIEEIREAVSLISGKAVVEASGGVIKTDLNLLADTGVDIISVGALTHSAKNVDMSMRIQPYDR